MTQQPYAPQFPGYPPQAPAPVAQQPQYAQPYNAPAQPVGYPPQPQGYGIPQQQPPAVPLAQGTIDDYYSQPATGGGAGISWKGKPDGHTIQGVVARDVTNADIQQDVGAQGSADAGKPKFYRDGRPVFVMSVPLLVQPSPEFPEGEARLYVRGRLKDELARAMNEAGAGTSPKAGDAITVTLVERRQGRGSIPANIFRVHYIAAQAGVTPQVPQAPAPQPVAQMPAAPVAPVAPPAPPQPVAQAPQYPPAPPVAPQQFAAPPVVQASPVQAQAPAPQPVAPQAPAVPGLATPPTLTPEQAQLFAQLSGTPVAQG